MSEISKADWKLFREKVPEWQERYMEKLVQKYVKLLTSPGDASEHFWELEKRIRNDKKHPGVMMQLEKGEAIWDIAILIRKRVITVKDLDGFSQELK
ncbi:MAG: multidrug transporter, partial [Lachnospiraceae bacterium]|nr:multidrug transporter [Lachnospiraceae bacterium]